MTLSHIKCSLETENGLEIIKSMITKSTELVTGEIVLKLLMII